MSSRLPRFRPRTAIETLSHNQRLLSQLTKYSITRDTSLDARAPASLLRPFWG